MPVHAGAERIAAVFGASQGSGYLLTGRLVLTAAHLLPDDGGEPTAVVHGGRGPVRCRVVGRSGDQALLLAEDDLVRPETADGFGPLRIGVPGGLEPLAGCHATGFPAVERDGRQLESSQFVGTVAPGTHLVAGQYVLSSADRPPAGDGTLWAGMSGAAVFFRGLLIGVVSAEPDAARGNHSRLTVTPVDPDLLHGTPDLAVHCVRVTEQDIADADFEARHAAAVRHDHGQLRIFGLDVVRARSRPRDLDTAYLSLEAEPADGHHPATRRGPQRVEQALQGRRRVLLRGQAGSGKSTLVQWLAVHAAAGDLGPELADLEHAVPFVLRLRSMYRLQNLRPRPAEFLHVDGSQLADAQPAGWAERVLRDGRALLLVDGLDEIPEADRADAEEWLSRLLRHYPGVFCLVTVRPSAVPLGWLAHLGFDELTLRPMSPEDRHTLIERWHRAVAGELPDGDTAQRREVAELRDALLLALATSPELAALTDSPLLCAMICTLHREWDGALPRRKMELYEAALNMLLVRRDQQRKVGPVEGVDLAKEEQFALLQRIAYWLTVNRQAEGLREDATRQIERLLPSLPAGSRPASAEQVLTHLFNRTGLLASPTADTFAFVHRTFQDYLAAREFAEEHSFGLLLGNAGDEQWSDVIRMTVGHCTPKDRETLLRELLKQAEHTENRALHVRMRVLAGSCLPYATRLNADVRLMVLRQLGTLLKADARLLTVADVSQLAAVGEDLAGHLPERLPVEPGEARRRLLMLAGAIGGSAAMDWLASLAPSLSAADTGLLAPLWESFEPAGYARTVLAAADLQDSAFVVDTAQNLELLASVGPIGWVTWLGAGRDLRSGLLAGPNTGGLDLYLDEEIEDLSCLAGLRSPGALWFHRCEAVRDFSALSGLPVETLGWLAAPSADHRSLWAALAGLPRLRGLTITDRALSAAVGGTPLPAVTEATLRVWEHDVDLSAVPVLLPGLRRIEVSVERAGGPPVDLSPLARLGGLRIGVEEEQADRFTGLRPGEG